MAFNYESFLKDYKVGGSKKKSQPKQEAFDAEDFLRNYKTADEPAESVAVPAPAEDMDKITAIKNSDSVKKKMALIESEIASGKRPDYRSPEPGVLDKLGAALAPGEMAQDAASVGQRVYNSGTLGLGPYVTEKLGGPTRKQANEFLASRPGTEFGGALAENAAIAGPAKLAGNLAQKVVAPVSRYLGKAAPVVESAVAGGAMGLPTGDTAEGAGVSAAMSAIPVVGKVIGRGADALRTNRAVNDLIRSRKKTVEKSLSQLGGTDKEEGKKELKSLFKREGLTDVIEGKDVLSKFDAKKRAVWDSELGPIHEEALRLQPNAAIPWKNIEASAKKIINDVGPSTPKAATVRKAIADLKGRIKDAGYSSKSVPITEVLENARALQSKGWAGVANYDSPTDIKQVARDFGRELRTLYDAKLGNIYKSKVGTQKAIELGEKYRKGNERYADLSKLNDPIDDLIARRETDRKGLISSLVDIKRQGVAAYLGHALGGVPAATGAVAANEVGRRIYPSALRQVSKLAKTDGKAASPQSSALVSQWLRNYMNSDNNKGGE